VKPAVLIGDVSVASADAFNASALADLAFQITDNEGPAAALRALAYALGEFAARWEMRPVDAVEPMMRAYRLATQMHATLGHVTIEDVVTELALVNSSEGTH
jgi:hypothetical protein